MESNSINKDTIFQKVEHLPESVEEKLFTTKIKKYKNSHLAIREQDICHRCAPKSCINVCPADTYSYDIKQGIFIAHENCLECGSCRIVCESGNIDWSYPLGEFGVDFKRG